MACGMNFLNIPKFQWFGNGSVITYTWHFMIGEIIYIHSFTYIPHNCPICPQQL